MPFANVTLTSLGGELEVVVFLPNGVKPGEDLYYYSSRFDHGSMIGSITRRPKEGKTHVLYGTDTWRIPHNSHWPESGVGLASEFGVGDDGALCVFRCGWPEATEVTNGVLGYEEVQNGESFLKIGVGELIKGSCPACDSTDDYRFNSPYLFASEPRWKMTRLVQNSNNEYSQVQLEHEATLRTHGYKINKDISLNDNILEITTTLQNLGQEAFSTVWYSHHFFSCDGNAVGPGYSVDLDIQEKTGIPLYDEPSTWTWSTPLDQYGTVEAGHPSGVNVEMYRALGPGTRIKAEFTDDHQSKGDFTLSACHSSVTASLHSPQDIKDGNNILSMYAYNLYVERGTFSPEPQLLLRTLQPRQSVSWTLRVAIDGEQSASSILSESVPLEARARVPSFWNLRSISIHPLTSAPTVLETVPSPMALVAIFCFVFAALFFSIPALMSRYRRRRNYNEL